MAPGLDLGALGRRTAPAFFLPIGIKLAACSVFHGLVRSRTALALCNTAVPDWDTDAGVRLRGWGGSRAACRARISTAADGCNDALSLTKG